MIRRCFSSGHVVCLLANSYKADRLGAKLMCELKSLSDCPLHFIGAGGEHMKQEGLEPFYETSNFHPKPFIPFRSTLAYETNLWLWLKRNPITRSYTRPMHEVLKLIEKERIIERIRRHRPSLVLTLDHDILSFRIHRQLSELYKASSLPRPKQAHFGRFVNRYKPYQLDYLDHAFYTIPIPERNWNQFKFPSTFVGQDAFAEALQFLLHRNGGAHLLSNDSVLMNRDHFYSETEQFIESERRTFRESNGIPPQATVLFLAPGNQLSEIRWSLPILQNTANLFISEYAEPFSKRSESRPLEHFVVVIPVIGEPGQLIKDTFVPEQWKGRVVFADTEQDRKSALAGSDLAICYNGDIVTECLVNQLTTIVIQNMRKLEFYCLLAWNRFTNDMNILADGNLFPEIIEGQCHAPKLLETLQEWYESPAHKFWPLQGFEMYLHSMLPMKKRELGMGAHHEYYMPSHLLAQSVWEMAKQNPPRAFAPEDNQFIRNLQGTNR